MITWVDVRIPVEIKPGVHTPNFATCRLIKGLLVVLPAGTDVDQMIREAVEAMGRAAVEATEGKAVMPRTWTQEQIDDSLIVDDGIETEGTETEECGMGDDGQCTLAGTEWCDFFCRYDC